MRGLGVLLLALSLLATALAAGFFYAYSVSVMPGLDAAPADAAIRAMQGINAVIRTPVFAFAFFGALAFPLLAGLALLATARGARAAAGLSLAAAAVYGAGVSAVTFAVNVPMNDALAAVAPPASTAEAEPVWRGYADPWTAWNHLRTAASVVACGLAAAALVAAFAAPPPTRSRPWT